jgi:drug/metabolite transporter (DMT)-like permease
LGFEWGVLPYSILFGISSGLCHATSVIAYGIGSLALTSLIVAYSLVIPTVYGLIFLDETLSTAGIIGVVLLVISIYLTNAKIGKKTESADEHKREKNKKKFVLWLICVSLTFVTNGMCAVIQKQQQISFGGAYKNEFMTLAYIVSVLLLLPIALKKDTPHMREIVRYGALPALSCGVANGISNLMVMLATAMLAASIFFPLISAGSIILSYILSRVLYKEKFSVYQNIGLVIGVISLVLLNL